MKEKHFENLQEEIRVQCELALMALEDLETALKDFQRTKDNKYIYHIWYSIHAFLVSTANISKIFKSPKPFNGKESAELHKLLKERGTELMKSLSVDENSSLLDRDPRNYMEHFNEHLNKWIDSAENPQRIDMSIGLLRRVEKEHPDLKNFLRFFDYEEFVLVFGGEKYPLKPIIDEIEKLLKEIKAKTSGEYGKGCPLS